MKSSRNIEPARVGTSGTGESESLAREFGRWVRGSDGSWVRERRTR